MRAPICLWCLRRILDTEYVPTTGSKRQGKLSVELWDSGGSPEYTECWPAIARQAHACIIVFNPDVEGQERECEEFHKYFAVATRLPAERCVLFANQSQQLNGTPRTPELPASLQHLRVVATNTETAPDVIRDAFAELMAATHATVLQQRDEEESGVLG